MICPQVPNLTGMQGWSNTPWRNYKSPVEAEKQLLRVIKGSYDKESLITPIHKSQTRSIFFFFTLIILFDWIIIFLNNNSSLRVSLWKINEDKNILKRLEPGLAARGVPTNFSFLPILLSRNKMHTDKMPVNYQTSTVVQNNVLWASFELKHDHA